MPDNPTPTGGFSEQQIERAARIIDPWAFNQCEWASRDDNDDLLRKWLPVRDAALTKARQILTPPDPAHVQAARERALTALDRVEAYIGYPERPSDLRALREALSSPLPPSLVEEVLTTSDRLGSWMSAALDDPNVCAEMKADINAWFAALEKTRK